MFRIIVQVDPEDVAEDRAAKVLVQQYLPFVGWGDTATELTTTLEQLEVELEDELTSLTT